MKTIALLLLLFIFKTEARAQKVAEAATKMNVFYVGIDNLVAITVENADCDDIIERKNTT